MQCRIEGVLFIILPLCSLWYAVVRLARRVQHERRETKDGLQDETIESADLDRSVQTAECEARI